MKQEDAGHRGSARSHCVENSLWKMLWTCCKTLRIDDVTSGHGSPDGFVISPYHNTRCSVERDGNCASVVALFLVSVEGRTRCDNRRSL